MAHDVFISYSHKDKAVADAICAKLEQDGSRCWYAPRDIRPGADWAASIIDAIEASKVMVLVFTDSSNASQQVLREINNAVTAGVVLVPFKLTDNPPNRGMRYYLSTVHWLDAMNGPQDKRISELSELVRTILHRDEPGTEAPAGATEKPAAPETQTGKRRLPLIAGIFTAALILVAAVLWLAGVFGHGADPKPPEEPAAIVNEAPALTEAPSEEPAEALTEAPTDTPAPTEVPTEIPTDTPAPTAAPTDTPSPTPEPTAVPTDTPSPSPTPTEIPTPEPTDTPSPSPTPEPTREPTYSTSAEDYIYAEGSGGIVLKKYMGTADVVIIPAEIDGLPVKKIDKECFEGHTELLKAVLPDSMRTLDYKAFHGCTNLRELTMPEGLHEIGGWALAHTALTSVRLPDSVKKMGYGCFYGCNKLTEVILPDSIHSIGEDTFHNCVRLQTVTIPSEEIDIHIEAFNSNAKVTLVGVAGSFTEKYAKAKGLAFAEYSAETAESSAD